MYHVVPGQSRSQQAGRRLALGASERSPPNLGAAGRQGCMRAVSALILRVAGVPGSGGRGSWVDARVESWRRAVWGWHGAALCSGWGLPLSAKRAGRRPKRACLGVADRAPCSLNSKPTTTGSFPWPCTEDLGQGSQAPRPPLQPWGSCRTPGAVPRAPQGGAQKGGPRCSCSGRPACSSASGDRPLAICWGQGVRGDRKEHRRPL